jgi:uncharacterized membrane protein YqiK
MSTLLAQIIESSGDSTSQNLLKHSGLIGAVLAIAVFFILVGILSRFYRRSSKELAFVRTGMGGQKVVSDGGAIVLPIFHQITPVNMMTLRLLVERKNEEALITLDRMRADVSAEFYVRVKKEVESIAQSAQSFGSKTMNPHELKELLQGKFVDALRSVAAGMDMQMLHEQRAEFVQSVQTTVAEDLSKNGLELEAVSLTGFDQTSIDYFNASNSFDAQGLANIAKITEAKREERNRIEQETRVQIEQKNLEAERKSLTIRQESEIARLEQERTVSTLRAEQEAIIKAEQILRQREAEEAQIHAQRELAMRNIQREQDVENSNIEKQKQLEMMNIQRLNAIALAEQESAVIVAKKSEEKSRAEAEAAKAMVNKVEQEENVTTVKRLAEANRIKDVEVLKAREEAEKNATRITIAAQAEQEAAKALAEAKLVAAKAEAQSIMIKAEADQKKFEIQAFGEKAINEAKNILSTEIMAFEFRKVLAELAPAIIAASVKPLEKIDSVKVISTSGPLIGGGGNGVADSPPTNMPDQLMNAVMKHRLQMPLVDDLLKQIGLDPSNPANLSTSLALPPASPQPTA